MKKKNTKDYVRPTTPKLVKIIAYANIILSFCLLALGLFPSHLLAIDFDNPSIRSAFIEIEHLAAKKEFYVFNEWQAEHPFYLFRVLNVLSNIQLMCALLFSIGIIIHRIWLPYIFTVFLMIIIGPILYFPSIDHWFYNLFWAWWSITNIILFTLSIQLTVCKSKS